VTDKIVVTDEDVDRFLQAAFDLRDPDGKTPGDAIMRRMGLDPSDLLLGNPSDEVAHRHGDFYRAVARHCDDKRYITWEADLYALVAIMPKGEGRIFGG
jgi:hypothetical protein